jgi:hypothetical protein
LMRITVDLNPEDLAAVSRLTGIEKKSPAVSRAIQEYLRQKEREAFLMRVLSGETDYSTSNKEIEKSTSWENASGN